MYSRRQVPLPEKLQRNQSAARFHWKSEAPPKSIINLEKLQYIRAGTTTHHQVTEAADQIPAQPAASMRRPYATLVSCLSKFHRHGRLNGGVKVPRGIGRLFDMHRLGVADIEAAGGDVILEELKKLTQLRKLGVSGVNRNHIQKFFTAVLDLAHLESLSLGLLLNNDDEAGCLDDISPPLNLRSLKLYGLVRRFPVWIKKLKRLRKLSLQMTMLPQEGIDALASSLPELENVRLFLSEFQDDELHFGRQVGREETIFLGLLEISCKSRVQAASGGMGGPAVMARAPRAPLDLFISSAACRQHLRRCSSSASPALLDLCISSTAPSSFLHRGGVFLPSLLLPFLHARKGTVGSAEAVP